MKHIVIFAVAFLTHSLHAENIALGGGALKGATNITDNIAIGKEAAAFSETLYDSVAIGNIAGKDITDGKDIIAIGKGALLGVSNIRRTVAIGNFEMLGENLQDDTTSINSKQLWVSKPLNAFAINPEKASHITNTPLHYIGGEMHLKADAIRLSSKASTIIGKEIVEGVEEFNIPLHVVVTNKDYSSGNTYIYRVTNCTASAQYYPSENDYTLTSFSVTVCSQAFEFSTSGTGAYYEEHYRYLYEDHTITHFGEIPIKPTGAITSPQNFSATITILDDYTALCTVPMTDYNRNFTSYITVKVPLHKALKDKPIDPILHQSVRKGEKNSLVSSAAVHDYVDERLNGISFKIENGALIVYQNGNIIGRLTLGN